MFDVQIMRGMLRVTLILCLLLTHHVSAKPSQTITQINQPVLFLPPNQPQAAHWQTNPTRTNLGTILSNQCYDGKYHGILKKLSKDPKTPCFAEYDWAPSKQGQYALFVATTRQGVGFTSPIQFQINDLPLKSLPASAKGTPHWGPSDAMSWTCLGVYEFTAEKLQTIRLQSSKRRSMDDSMSMYVNGFFAIDMNQPVQTIHVLRAQFMSQNIQVGQKLIAQLTFKQTVNGSTRCALQRRGETVLESMAVANPNNSKQVLVSWQLPEDLPSDEYQLEILPQFFQTVKLPNVPTIHISGRKAPLSSGNTLSIAEVKWENAKQKQLQIKLNQSPTDQTRLGLWFFDENNLLKAASDIALQAGVIEQTVQLPNALRWQNAGHGQLHVFIHHSQKLSTIKLPLNRQVSSNETFKPMAHGVYQDENKLRQHWYVRDDHMMVWDGKPWVPVGGMFCSPVLTYPSMQNDVRQRQWEIQKKSLDTGLQAGLECLYVNLGHGPQWLKQSVINDLNQRKIPFGWQLGFRQPIQVYPIRSHIEQGLIHGQCDDKGNLTIALPRQKISKLLLVGPMSDPQIHPIDLDMNLDAGHKPDFIQLDLTQDSENGKMTTVRMHHPALPQGKYYALAQVTRKEHFGNLWDKFDNFKTHYQWLKQINWGEQLRLFIDPSGNEEGLYNESESVRVNSHGFETWYANWLRKKYQTIGTLETRWSLPAQSVSDWQQASRLVPLRDLDHPLFKQHIWWVDPQTSKLFVTDNDLGSGWDDYIYAVRFSYAQQRDKLAKMIKQIINVPIVFKRVSPWVNIETVNTTPGGFDGVGLELYPAWGSVIAPGLATGAAEARMASQTMWLLGTEMGYSAQAGNKGIKGWPSFEYVKNFITTTANFGSKGFFFFGWRLEPAKSWGNNNLDAIPEQVQWITDVIEPFKNNWPTPALLGQAYPQGHAWYFRSAGKPLTRDTALYPNASSSIIHSVMVQNEPDLWAVSSNMPLPDADPILVNFSDAHAVAHFAPQVQTWLKQGKHVIYTGHWPSAKPFIRGLSEHFDRTVLKDEQGPYQALRLKSGDIALAKSKNGKVWAKISDRLLIITRPITPRANNDVVPTPLVSQWVKELMKR